MLELKIYKTGNHKKPIKNIVVLGLLFIGIYIIKQEINVAIILVPLLLFILFTAITDRGRKPIGQIQFDINQINIISNNKSIQLKLSEIETIEMFYSGYKGKRVHGDFIPSFNKFSGTDNYIQIKRNQEEYKYNILFENINQENEFVEMLERWKFFGFDTSKITMNR